jgi:hypothetical protein
MALTELKRQWIADALGVDTQKVPAAPYGNSAGSTRRVADSGGDAKAPTTPSVSAPAHADVNVAITIENASDASLLIVEEFLTRLSFDGVIPGALGPGEKATLKFGMPEITSDLLLYAAVPAGTSKAPKDAPRWELKCWIEPGGKLQAESQVDEASGLKAEWTTDGKGKLLFKLSGKLATAASAPVPPARLSLGIDNQSDRKLRLIKVDNGGGRFDPAPPAEIAPGKKAAFAAINVGAKGGSLIYELEAKEGATEEPDKLPWWTMSWMPSQPGQPPQPDSTLDPNVNGLSPAAAAGKNGIAFMLTGTSAVATQAPTTAQPQPQATGMQQRIDVTFVNQSDMVLKYWGADRMTAAFDKQPPQELKPGASASFAIFGKGDSEIHFGLMYAILPTANDKAENTSPMWTPNFTIPPGLPMSAKSDILPGINGLRTDTNPGTAAVSFVLSGKAAGQPQSGSEAGAQERRIDITLDNRSNMVLKYWGADRMTVKFDKRPPPQLKPGEHGDFAIFGDPNKEITFGLMYSILPSADSSADNQSPKWTPHFRIPPGEGGWTANSFIVPAMGGLKTGESADKNAVTFVLVGKWAKDQELKTPVSIQNESSYTLRLVSAAAAPGRFDPAPPTEVAPHGKASCASWAKESSKQTLVYELIAADATRQGTSNAKPKRWTMIWNTTPGERPRSEENFENFRPALSGGGIPEEDGVVFQIEIRGEAEKK